MSFEGTGKYFWMLFLFYCIIVLTVKICLSNIFKKAGEKGWKAFIPFYNRLVLVNILDLKKSVFYKTLIPVANLYYYYVIIGRMLEVFEMNKKDAIFYLLVPMYKFPELVFRNPSYKLHMYDETEKFFHNEKSLFEKEPVKEIPVSELNQAQNVNAPQMSIENTDPNKVIIDPSGYNQLGQIDDEMSQKPISQSVFTNSLLEPDERKETVIEAKKQEVKEDVNPIISETGRPKVCPRCGTKLESTANVCFFCGTHIPWQYTLRCIIIP